jgi:hypothetical protein
MATNIVNHNLNILIKKIPKDIVFFNIIPYTYQVQPSCLLEDIRDYYNVKKEIFDNKYYDVDMIKHEIYSYLSFFYVNFLKFILRRHIIFQNYDEEKMNKYLEKFCKFSIHKRFNILLGLFTVSERLRFTLHINEDYFFQRSSYY